MKTKCLSRLASLVLTAAFCLLNAPAVQSEQPVSQCGPFLGGAIANTAYECINDSTMLLVQDNDFQWQYAHDSNNDGVTFTQLGAEFEFHGLAFKETLDSIYFVVNGDLSLTGLIKASALGGSITHGDIFLNLSEFDFKTASENKVLYAIRYAATNDADVTEDTGVFKNVEAMSVSTQNSGFSTLQAYENKVYQLGGTPHYGDFDHTQTYYAKNISFAVIKSGEYVGPIEWLTPHDLGDSGYDFSQFEGDYTYAFRFPKSYIVDVCGVEGGDGTSCLDCSNVPCGTCTECDGNNICLDCVGVVDQCGVCEGDGTSCLDCADVPFGNAELDECGVCEGDGTSCLECLETNNAELLVSYDSKALEQRNAAFHAARALRRLARANSQKRLVRRAANIRARAQELYNESWNMTWQLPTKSLDCGLASQCITVSHTSQVEGLRENARLLRNAGRRAYRLARRLSGQSKFRVQLRRRINQLYQESEVLAEGLPLSTSVCD